MKILFLPALVLLLAACASTAPPAAKGRAGAALPAPAQMVAAVRQAGVNGNELEVQPLRDPQVEDLRARAQAEEAAGRHKAADAALLQALAIVPDDPDLLQWRAELALLRKDWAQAEVLANASYEKGPRLGGLCRRNWTAVQFAREAKGNAAGAGLAREQVGRCIVAPPVRM